MTTITIKINERTKAGKAFIAMAETFFKDAKGIEIIETPIINTKLNSPLVTKNKLLRDFETACKQLQETRSRKTKRKSLDELLDEK